MKIYDAIVIGASHNGLTNAAYLAEAGRDVLVLEMKPLPSEGLDHRYITQLIHRNWWQRPEGLIQIGLRRS